MVVALVVMVRLAGLAAPVATDCTCTYTATDMACDPTIPGCQLGIQVRSARVWQCSAPARCQRCLRHWQQSGPWQCQRQSAAPPAVRARQAGSAPPAGCAPAGRPYPPSPKP